MDTVRIEYMIVSEDGAWVISNWQALETNVMNDPQIYIPRGNQILQRFNNGSGKPRVRVVSEQSNRIVDIIS